MALQASKLRTPAPADEAAVRALYQQMVDGWNHGSGEAFAAPFADDADFIAFDGTHFRGGHDIASSHQLLFDKWLKGSRLVGQIMGVRFLSPDVAWIHAIGGTIMSGKSRPSPERDSVQTLVAVRRDGEWHLTAFQNTECVPSAVMWRGLWSGSFQIGSGESVVQETTKLQ